MTGPLNNPPAEAADETTPRDSEPVVEDFQGEEDPDSEIILRALLTAGADGKGV
ncbi:hypothetical protein OHA72_38045 [Dactylosporangium sp. NBC_01737]|uniref:hypothetical protein n=1 Tax=Dactylosporangium sp. NBC_01737 TaxID=2975959 RepID=UPI002E0DAD61|nr:hypothetical protein OHA72_38045 [Dactylosporangium sp. NBC_01737]